MSRDNNLGIQLSIRMDHEQFETLNCKLDKLLEQNSPDSALAALVVKGRRIADHATAVAKSVQQLTQE